MKKFCLKRKSFVAGRRQTIYQITESDYADLKKNMSFDTSERILQGDKRYIARIDSGYADDVYYTLERVDTDYADGGKQETYHLSLGCSLTEALFDSTDEHCFDRMGITVNYLTSKDMNELKKWLETYLTMNDEN